MLSIQLKMDHHKWHMINGRIDKLKLKVKDKIRESIFRCKCVV